MEFLRSSWKIGLAAVVGFVFGVLAFHMPTAKAQSGGVSVHVQQAQLLKHGSANSVNGSQVVGFSCVQNEKHDPECYIASIK
jgi:hypothetical protein